MPKDLERFTPDLSGQIAYEHLHRYALCRSFDLLSFNNYLAGFQGTGSRCAMEKCMAVRIHSSGSRKTNGSLKKISQIPTTRMALAWTGSAGLLSNGFGHASKRDKRCRRRAVETRLPAS